MNRVRLDELMRAWLESLARSEDAGVAAMAACAIELHDALRTGGSLDDRASAAARYVSLVETLMSSGARPSRGRELREGTPVDALVSGDLDRFWGRALENLKRHLEAEDTPPAGQRSPRKPS
jgi:hypothetical protein